MEERKYESTPSYGFIMKDYKRFNDKQLFKGRTYLFAILKSIKIWYGTPAKGDINLTEKAILGIECGYKILEGKAIKSEMHSGKIESNDVETESLELKEDDFFCKFHICFDDIITYIKLESYKGKVIEKGKYDEKLNREISFNADKNPHVIQYLYGFYDDYGLRAVGFQHVPKINMFVLSLISILRLRHQVKTDKKKRDYWSNENNLKDLDIGMKAIAKCAFLPDGPFSTIFKYCVS